MKNKLLIIYYHEVVSSGCGFSYQKIEINKFSEQMKYLHENGYQTLFFSELDKPLPDKAIIVSFDDGFKSVYENAYPIMQKYKIKGNIYLPTAYIGKDNHFMTWDMIREMVQSQDFEMQAHTHNHIDIRTLNEKELQDQIIKSDSIFMENLNCRPVAFCMPFGTFDRASGKLIKNQNRYKYILGSYYGRANESNLSNIVLPRIGISDDDTIDVFKSKLEGLYDWKGILQKLRLSYHNLRKDRITTYEY